MKKIGLIAGHEFIAAVSNKGFVIGLLILPAMIALFAVVVPRLINQSGPPMRGEIAVVDPTGQVAAPLRGALAPAAILERRTQATRAALATIQGDAAATAPAAAAIDRTIGQIPQITIAERPAGASLDREKAWLSEESQDLRHVGVVVVHPDAVTRKPGAAGYGGYDLYVPPNVDERIEGAINDGLREALVGARLNAGSLDRNQIEALMRVPTPRSVTVTKTGETRATERGLNRSLPFIFAGLLVFGVMIGGQTLLTGMVEEKSSRVVEVLLSAVSPFELMAGKLLGQMAVSLLVLAVYIGLGATVLVSAAMIGLIDPLLILYLLLFFLITYLVFGSIMIAIGAAVNEMREAQSLLGPVMILLMAPWIFAFPIARDPNTTFATVLSFLPPVNTFVMMTRLTSSAPPPAWQAVLTMVIGVVTAVAALWFAGKIFKIGLLMHGKAPNFATLVRWAKAA